MAAKVTSAKQGKANDCFASTALQDEDSLNATRGLLHADVDSHRLLVRIPGCSWLRASPPRMWDCVACFLSEREEEGALGEVGVDPGPAHALNEPCGACKR